MNLESQLPPKARLLKVAADLLANSNGKPVSTRQITELAQVSAPTLYHHFGDKEGLFNAVIDSGFEEFVAGDKNLVRTGKPLVDVRQIWDNHLMFGLANPHLYSVMFGNIRPESRPARVAEAEGFMEEMLERAAASGQLRVTPQEAARSILAANVGVTLMLIAEPAEDRNFDLSQMTREAVISAVSSEEELNQTQEQHGASSVVVAAIALNAALESSHPEQLSTSELKLFLEWLHRISKAN